MNLNNVRCGYETEPVGIKTDSVRFSWQIESDSPVVQQGYSVTISDENGHILWDSGCIYTSEQTALAHDAKLEAFREYGYKVEVRSDKGEKAVAKGCFFTGIGKRADWRFGWFDAIRPYGTRVRLVRRVFSLTDDIKDAVLFIAAMGDKMNAVRAYINGKAVMDSLCFPGAAEPFVGRYRGFRLSSDIFQKGVNTLSLDFVRSVSAYLIIRSVDGGICTVEPDDRWEYLDDGPFVEIGYDFAEKHHGKYEEYDERKMPHGWRNGEAAEDVKTAPQWMRPPVILRYLPDRVVAYHTAKAQRLTKLSNGKLLVDFGKNGAGFPAVCLREKEGTTVEIEMSEAVNDDGSLLLTYGIAGMRAAPRLKITSGHEITEYMPSFFHTSMRYMLITGLENEYSTEDFEMLYLSSDIGAESFLSTDDPTVNLFDEITRRTYRSNLLNMPTDCPGRERRGWTADSYSVIRAQAAMFRISAMHYRWFEDMQDNQRMDGWLHVEYPMNTALSADMDWSVGAVLCLSYLYRHNGDKTMLRDFIECADRFAKLYPRLMNDEFSIAETAFSYGDWTSEKPCMSKRFVGLLYYCHAADQLAFMYGELGENDKACEYEKLAQKIRVHIQTNESHGNTYECGSQSSDIHILAFRICRDEERRGIFEHLIQSINEAGRLTCGFMSTALLFPLLGEFGRNDLAFELLTDTNPDNNSLMGWVKKIDATTVPEHAGQINASRNHSFQAGGMTRWLYEYLLGIKPAAPGYAQTVIAPWIASPMNQVFGAVETPFGEIRVAWKKSDNVTQLHIEVPATVECVLEVNGETKKLTGRSHDFNLEA